MAPVKLKDTDVTRWRGLNNKTDPLALGLSWLQVARNIDITDADKPQRRDGYSLLRAGTIAGAYSTLDFERLYYVDAGVLKDGAGNTLASGIDTSARVHWCEVNQEVYFNTGASDGIIMPDNEVRSWSWTIPASPTLAAITGSLPAGTYRVVCTFVLADGRETGTSDEVSIELADGQALQVSALPAASGCTTRTYIAPAHSQVFGLARTGTGAFTWNSRPEALGVECATYGLDPLPEGASVVQMWNGRAWASVYEPRSGMSFIYPSKALAFHLFDLEDFVPVKGEVLMLAPAGNSLLIGTGDTIAALSTDGRMTVLANYGVVPGWCWALDPDKGDEEEGQVLIWSKRGVCRAMPFKNLTDRHFSPAAGTQAGAAVIATAGQKRFVACLHAGGTAFNAR